MYAQRAVIKVSRVLLETFIRNPVLAAAPDNNDLVVGSMNPPPPRRQELDTELTLPPIRFTKIVNQDHTFVVQLIHNRFDFLEMVRLAGGLNGNVRLVVVVAIQVKKINRLIVFLKELNGIGRNERNERNERYEVCQSHLLNSVPGLFDTFRINVY
jgi:hypothetical protein